MAKSSERRSKRRSAARRRAEEHKSGFEMTSLRLPEGVELFKVEKAGVYRFDVVSYICKRGKEHDDGNEFAETGEEYYERTFWNHRGIGADQASYVCPRKTAKLPCPICEDRTRMSKDDDPDEDLIKDLAPKERQLWNILDHDNVDAGVQVWECSYHLFGKQMDGRINDSDEEDGYEDFYFREDGATLKVGFDEESFGKFKFYKTRSIDFKKRPGDLSKEYSDAAVDLDAALVILSYEELKAVYLQTSGGDKSASTTRDGNGGERDEDKPAPWEEEQKKDPTADECGIERGDEVQYNGSVCTVLKISPDGTSLTLVDDKDDFLKAISPADVSKIDESKKEGEVAAMVDPPETKTEAAAVPAADSAGDDDEWDNDWDE